MLVFVRRGLFVRAAEGKQTTLDPTVASCMNPGEAQRHDHPHEGGDDCTALGLDSRLAADLWGGADRVPSGPLRSPPRTDLEHRLLLAAGRRGADPDELVERSIALAASVLEQVDSPRVASGRPGTEQARRSFADRAREALAADPHGSLPDLARELASSPYHRSRLFHVVTGSTVSRHRMRLRARAALERISDGDHDLARLAAELGFSDQSHLCRVIRSEPGHTPSALRNALAGASGARKR